MWYTQYMCFVKDAVLAERILQENAYDSQLAILELLQLMDLSESRSKGSPDLLS